MADSNVLDFTDITNARFMLNDFPDIMSIKDLQNALQVGRSVAYSLVNDNHIQSFKIGNIHKIPKANVVKYIIQNSKNA